MGNDFNDGVVAAAPSADSTLITLEQAKAYIGVSDSDSDSQITAFIESAAQLFELYTGRKILSETVTEYQDGNGSRFLYLDNPATAVTSIHLDANHEYGATTLISASSYYLHLTNTGDGRQVEYDDNLFTKGRRNLKIVYTAGFSTIPDDIQQAAKIQVARMYSEWKRAEKGNDILDSQTVDGWAQKWLAKAGIDQAAMDILDRYKTWAI